ncbi:APC family permease [Rhodanobacter sp. Si-c]|uniref:APC family permease n=1 Tax=Rhodanobacter lycopersici TaxID=3162487 RepID=A0ABV3Q9H3_9GAMM
MPASGSFHRELSLTDLTFIGLGAIFGSGWLFSASHVAAIAGPAGIVSWLIGGAAVLLLGLVYCELGAALPRAGGVVRYPEYSHGVLLGSLMAFVTLIAFSSLIAIETVACRQYAAAWFPALSRDAAGDPTVLGWFVQLALLALFFVLNYFSVKTFAKANNLVSIFKFLVPLLVIVVLLTHYQPQNMHLHGFAPHGFGGVERAVSAGGVIFAYLGLTPIVSVASEVRDPQRTIPIALILSVLLSTAIYLLLQLAFLGSIPASLLAHGWSDMGTLFALPYHDIALTLGIGWLATLVVCDAVISPSGTGNIYMNATPRVVYAWARSGAFFPCFTHIDERSGIPRAALWLSFALSVFWTLPFPSWQAMINVVSAALVLSYAMAPITVAALRRNAPQLARPFRVRAISLLGPLSFIVATLIVYWSSWQTVSWLLGLQIALFAVYVLYRLPTADGRARLRHEVSATWWLVAYYALLIALSWLGSFGGRGSLAHPWDSLAVALVGLLIYHWGARSGLPAQRLDLGTDAD